MNAPPGFRWSGISVKAAEPGWGNPSWVFYFSIAGKESSVKTKRKWLNCVCVCVNVTLLLAFPFNSFSQEEVAAPIYKDGDFWVFRVTQSDRIGTSSTRRDGEYQVSYADRRFKVSRLLGDETDTVESRGDDLRGLLGIESKNKQFQYLQFPLFVGQTWSREYQYSGGEGGRYALRRRTAKQSVVGIEQITTPAGTFRTFKIESDRIGAGLGGEVLVLLYHYSPGSKSIVKFLMSWSGERGAYLGTTEIELIKFGTAL